MAAIKRYFILFISLIIALNSIDAQDNSSQKSNKPVTKYTYKIIPASNHTFGYDIYGGGKLFVHQSSKPGMPGNEGFKLKKDAEKVARLVIKKLQKGILPPTITVKELDDLKVNH